MRIFFDTEFTGLHQDTTLISIGLVDENGREFYAELIDFDMAQVDDWIKENVLDHLTARNQVSMRKLRKQLTSWLAYYDKIEVWSDCLAYDWVLFCQIFGGAFQVPRNVYYIPFDICTFFQLKGVDPDINREEYAFGKKAVAAYAGDKDNSLHDARIIKACWERLTEQERWP